MSPYTLLQEELSGNAWKIFVCCIFCNLTKRRSSEPYFWEVLKRWPTPKLLSEACEEELVNLIQSLGLSRRRSKALKRMSYEFIHKDWKGNPTCLYGIGKYANDAYQIFVLNNWKEVQPTDGALKNYISWKKENEYICA